MNGTDSNTSGANQAKLRFKPAQSKDVLSKSVIEELERRGFVAIEVVNPGNILIQPEEPGDKTKIWWKSDINKIPQGSPLTWNAETGKWEPITIGSGNPYVPPQKRYGVFTAPAAKSQHTLEFESMRTMNYFVTLTPSLFIEGSWHTPPDAFPANFGYLVSGKSENTFQVNIYGAPVGGMSWEWYIEEKPFEA